eukprot:CAMPEP_0174230680 /NCGR_PEP_ID=MMETSP0417-20130205/1388_1 /TAXON_ID=242541 /ORGANISM="Mayorella sp, Strain BSH-02190019" /LENGTH=849 /DNA_ID=CAMNT_0015308415 /DNA_START=250 /DNA_END=2799 /DNA_ORIENTATION=-
MLSSSVLAKTSQSLRWRHTVTRCTLAGWSSSPRWSAVLSAPQHPSVALLQNSSAPYRSLNLSLCSPPPHLQQPHHQQSHQRHRLSSHPSLILISSDERWPAGSLTSSSLAVYSISASMSPEQASSAPRTDGAGGQGKMPAEQKAENEAENQDDGDDDEDDDDCDEHGRHVASEAALRLGLSPSASRGDPRADPSRTLKLLQAIGKQVRVPLVLPTLLVVGSPGSGKSSVIEAFLGFDFLPKASTCPTRRPIEIEVTREPSGGVWCLLNGRRFYRLSEVKERITRENRDIELEMDPTRVELFLPNIPEVTIVEFPALLGEVSSIDLPNPEFVKKLEKIVRTYSERLPKALLIPVFSAPELVALDENTFERCALRRLVQNIEESGNAGKRCLGVITHLDQGNRALTTRVLTNKEMPLSLGYVGVIGRASKDPLRLRQYLERELDVLQHHGYLHNEEIATGTISLRNSISEYLIRESLDQLPRVLKAVEKKIKDISAEFSLLSDLSAEDDLEFIARVMDHTVMQLAPNATARAGFEAKVATGLEELVTQMITDAGVWKFVKRSRYAANLRHISSSPGYATKLDTLRQTEAAIDQIFTTMDTTRRVSLTDSLRYGFATSENWEMRSLTNTLAKSIKNLIRGLDFVLSSTNRKKRTRFQSELLRLTTSLLDQDLPSKSLDVLDQTFSEWFAEQRHVLLDDPSQQQNTESVILSLDLFAYCTRYALQNIEREKLIDHIKILIKREIRATVSAEEILNEIPMLVARDQLVPHATPRSLDVGDHLWNRAYGLVLAKRLSNDIFRLLAVEAIAPVIYQISSDTRNIETLFGEASDRLGEMLKLKQYAKFLKRTIADMS